MPLDSPALTLVPIAFAPARSAARAVAHADDVVGPGWFESSWDLQRGLEIREGWLSDGARVGSIARGAGAQGASFDAAAS